MKSFSLFSDWRWNLLSFLGIDSILTRVEVETIIYTWVVLLFIAAIACVGRLSIMWYPQSVISYIYKRAVRAMMTMTVKSCKVFEYRYVWFFSTLFLFLLISNCLILIPGLEEPTKDLNTTLALGIIAFLFAQQEAIRAHGMLGYLNDLFKTPVPVFGVYQRITILVVCKLVVRVLLNILIGLLVLPLELLGKCSSIISLAFRLFGNIFAGSAISSLWLHYRSGSIILQLVGFCGLNILIALFFGLFEGCLQAFVFVMLSLSLVSRALHSH